MTIEWVHIQTVQIIENNRRTMFLLFHRINPLKIRLSKLNVRIHWENLHHHRHNRLQSFRLIDHIPSLLFYQQVPMILKWICCTIPPLHLHRLQHRRKVRNDDFFGKFFIRKTKSLLIEDFFELLLVHSHAAMISSSSTIINLEWSLSNSISDKSLIFHVQSICRLLFCFVILVFVCLSMRNRLENNKKIHLILTFLFLFLFIQTSVDKASRDNWTPSIVW